MSTFLCTKRCAFADTHRASHTPCTNGCTNGKTRMKKACFKYCVFFSLPMRVFIIITNTTQHTAKETEIENDVCTERMEYGSSTFKDFSFHKETIKLNCYFLLICGLIGYMRCSRPTHMNEKECSGEFCVSYDDAFFL